jgi:hypothetical protein
VWVFTRSGTTWTQQGPKLVGTGATGHASQGWSVALSGDGNTALVGGDGDNGYVGAAWVFTRSGTTWTQQGRKLVGTGATGGDAEQGFSLGLSSDGNTALIGGPGDNDNMGAVWVFATRQAVTRLSPGTKVTKAKISSKHQQATFSFKAIGTATGFQCALVKQPKATFKPCESPKTYKHLKRGKYTFEVRAFNAAGAEPTPAKKSFTIT